MGIWNGVELGTLILAGPRLTLRPWLAQDAPACCEAAQDRLMREFLPLPDPYTARDAEEWVTTLAPAEADAGTGIASALVESATGRLVGGATLRLAHDQRAQAEIGYSVYPWARGQAYAAEAADTLAKWAFEYGVGRIAIHCSVRNLASAKAALAAGFSFECIQRLKMQTRSGLDDGAAFIRLARDAGTPIAATFVALPDGQLSDGTLALRVTAPTDTPALIEEHDDPITRSWNFNDEPTDLVRLTAMTAGAGLQWLVGSVARLSMVDLATGAVAGSMQVRAGGPPGVASIGYGVHPAFRGRGYTTRALRLLMAWAFEHAGYARLELGAKAANIASQKAALHAGFGPDGVRRARLRNPDGSFSDEVRFAAVNPALDDQSTN